MTKFADLKLDPKVLQAIAEAGYETPTPIQAGAVPPALEGRDVLGIAQTGTGKTASFTLPMITLLGRGRARARMPRSLVLCPTRELAAQVAENFEIYAKHTKLTKALLIGGVSFTEQDKLIDRGVDVLIATPGRLLDHFERGKLLLTGVQIMVVDEADRMLDMGFIPDIERIFQLTPFTRQTLFFSATMAPEIERITNTFLHAPARIEVARQATASETITQKLVEIVPARKDQTAKQKRALLRALIDAESNGLKNAIIFCNRKTDVDIVAKSLKKHGFDAAPIHGDLDQGHRTRTLDEFRESKLKFLIASDVAARGLDIPAVSHVFNFDLPSHAEDYVHRIGRTGRAGLSGTAISLSSPSDVKYLGAIEDLLKRSLPRAALPDGFVAPTDGPDTSRPKSNSRHRGARAQRPSEPAEAAPAEAPTASTPAPAAPVRERSNGHRLDRRRPAEQRGGVPQGMGEHVPQFMLVDLRPALNAARDSAEPSAGSDDDAETPEQTDSETRRNSPRSGRNRNRSRSRGPEKPEPQTDLGADTGGETPPPAQTHKTDTAAQGETAADAGAEASIDTAPATKTRRRIRKPKAVVEAGSEPASSPDSEPQKPRRTRKKAAAPASEGEVTATAAPAPKKRSRRKTSKADAASAGEATPEQPLSSDPSTE